MITLPAKVISLVTKHNFHASRVEYAIEIALLGSKFTIPVTESFVERLDNAVEPQESPAPRQREREYADYEDDVPQGFSMGVLEKSADDYTDEEIERL
jgi:hypothetical protein